LFETRAREGKEMRSLIDIAPKDHFAAEMDHMAGGLRIDRRRPAHAGRPPDCHSRIF
jgi:hypothetical protein